MFQSKKAKIEEAITQSLQEFEQTLPNLVALRDEANGVTVLGVTVTPARQGGGFLAILKLDLDGSPGAVELTGQAKPGRYVLYAHDEDPLIALLAIEATLAVGVAALTPDKYAK